MRATIRRPMGSPRLDAFLRALTARHRVLLLGGLAVIAHGLSRATKDADVWLDPLDSSVDWAAAVQDVASQFPETALATLPGWRRLASLTELAAAADEIGMVRVLGLECPLDIFRRPNELDEAAFDEVWGRSTMKEDGVRLPEPLDVLQSKLETGRDSDCADLAFLESKVRGSFGDRLATATLEEARHLFARYTDHVVARRALANPNPAVQLLAREILEELAAQGDPFSRDLLATVLPPD